VAVLPCTAQQTTNSEAMKNKFQGLRTVIYRVDDLNQAKAWYEKAFDTAPYFDEPFYVGFNIGGYELGLLPQDSVDNNEKSESVLAYWGVDDANKKYNYLIELGAKAHEEPKDVGDGIITAGVKDPWGNIIGIIYNPYFKLKE